MSSFAVSSCTLFLCNSGSCDEPGRGLFIVYTSSTPMSVLPPFMHRIAYVALPSSGRERGETEDERPATPPLEWYIRIWERLVIKSVSPEIVSWGMMCNQDNYISLSEVIIAMPLYWWKSWTFKNVLGEIRTMKVEPCVCYREDVTDVALASQQTCELWHYSG